MSDSTTARSTPATPAAPDSSAEPESATALAPRPDPGAGEPHRRRTGTSSLVSRRRFLLGLAASAAAVGHPERVLARRKKGDPSPAESGIDHVIVVMMENRSFDHLLGWLPRADGRQAGLVYVDRAGVSHATFPLAPDYQGCGHPDPDHSYEGGRIEFNGGACDGWLRAGDNDEFAIGYYTRRDLRFLAPAASEWTTCDRYFASIMAETFPNRIYQHAAQTDRIINSFTVSALPTIWDRLADARLTGRYYFSDVPFLALWGSKYIPISDHVTRFFADCAAGTLPDVAFVEPRFLDESTGTSNDDHPFADIRAGESFLGAVYDAVTRSPAWSRTLLVVNYDEWGGFFEHVPPPTAPIPMADRLAGNLDGRLGFRVPCVVVSPFARRGHVSSVVLDHTSILSFIEWRWDLPPLTERDATANNLADVLDFSKRHVKAPRFNVPRPPLPTPCLPGQLNKWITLATMALQHGWPL